MDTGALIRDAILLSMFLLVASVGMRSTAGDALYLIGKPGLSVRSLLAMSIVFPLLTIGFVSLLDLRPAVKIALIALSLSPVPPFLPDKLLKMEHNRGYVYALFVGASLVGVGLIPAAMMIITSHIGVERHIGPAKVLGVVASTVLIPLAVGSAVRYFWPRLASRLSHWFSVIGGVLLLVASAPILFSMWPDIRSLIGDGTLLAIAMFTVTGLVVGHGLGGPDPDDRSVLALATASRHPAVALAIGAASFPGQPDVPAAVVLALATGLIVSAPYTVWRKRVHDVLSETPVSQASRRHSH